MVIFGSNKKERMQENDKKKRKPRNERMSLVTVAVN